MLTPRRTAFLSFLALVTLSGCQTFPASGTGDWQSVRAMPTPVAQAVAYAHPVRFIPGDGVLLKDQREALAGFISRTHPKDGDTVRVHAHSGMVNAARVAVVQDALARHGVSTQVAPATPAQGTDVVRVHLRTHVVRLPGCPDWTGHPSHTFDNQPTRNFGCATAQNLGLMIADPADLNGGRTTGPANGAVQADAVRRYHQGKTKALLGNGSTQSTDGITTTSGEGS